MTADPVGPAPSASFASLSRLPGDVVSITDPDGSPVWVSDSVERTLGYTPEEYRQRAGLGLLHPDDHLRAGQLWGWVLGEPGREGSAEVRVQAADGTWRWIESLVWNGLDDPDIGGIVTNFRDISERKEAEQAVAASEARFRALVRSSAEVILVADPDGTITYVSDAVRRVFGLEPDELLGADRLDLIHPEDEGTAVGALSGAFAEPGAECTVELRVRRSDGTWRWVEITCRNLVDDPVVGGVVLNVRDVDDRVRSEQALRASEEQLLAVLEASRDVVLQVSADGSVVWVSPTVAEMLGYPAAEVVGRNVFALGHPDDVESALIEVARTLEGERGADPVTVRLQCADGSWLPVEVAANLLHDELGDATDVIMNLRDVSWRVAAEEALRAREQRFRALVQESTDVVMLTDGLGKVLWASPALEHVLGHRPEDLVGTDGAELLHPDDLARLVEELTPVFSEPGARARAEARARRASGEWAWIEETFTNLLEDERIGAVVIHLRDVTDRHLAEEAMRASEERFRAIAQSSPIGIFQQDVVEGCVYVNERWQEITGLTLDEALGDGWVAAFHPDDLVRLGADPQAGPLSEPWEAELRVVRPDGEVRWVSVRVAPLLDEEGRLRGNVGAVEDVTERREAQRDSARLTDIFEATDDLVGIADQDDRILYLNRAARRFFDLPVDGPVVGLDLGSLFRAEVRQVMRDVIVPVLAEARQWSGELGVARADGEVVPMLAQVLLHDDPDGDAEYYSAVMHDISERKQFESQLAHQATHDPLTGLPNRTLLLDRLGHALSRARRQQSRVAVLFLDLDHFKVVNDSLGHGLGDRLLVAIAERLRVALRPGDTIARFGGDEFVVLCEDLINRTDAIAIAERVDRAVSGAFEVDDNEVYVGVSIGIAFPDDHDVDPATLIRDADAAMYRAKEKGRARWEVFDNAMRASAVDRLDIESALRRALDRRELRVFYQPLIDLATGRIRAVEALLRWEHPERGLLTPGEFITVAEETGLIVPVGAWVLEQACRQVHRWHASVPGLGGLGLSVNLSGRQLSSAGLVTEVAEIVAATHMEPSRLELEITESVLMDDVAASEQTLVELKRLGVRLGIDDFGTGYSSMSYLRRFPVDVLKVDRSFVDGLGTDPSDSAIVAAIVTLAHTLGLKAVAEGVETAEQLAELRALGCDHAQGFLFSRPVPGDELAELLGSEPSW